MPTFGAWEAEVLEATYEMVDYISLHAYYDPSDGDADSFLASGADMEHMIRSITATADHVGAKLRSKKRSGSPSTSGNVWYQSRFPASRHWTGRSAAADRGHTYDVTDAVVVGQPAHHAASQHRPGRRRLPGSVANVIARSGPSRVAGVAAEHLPPVRADRTTRPRPGAAGGAGVRGDPDRQVRGGTRHLGDRHARRGDR
ncbi:hypothetical protein GCM10018952_25170 [Streptosporangium vulgare]